MNTCARIALDIKTYYAGQNQATHPNVISFQEPWHGYKYYMAYTAYPYANGSEENPCLSASNDLIHWEKPEGLINPIACCEETECDELKDTHLIYRKDKDQLEMWYLGRIGSTIAQGGSLCCFRKVSSDGVHWGPYEVVYIFSEFGLTSPSVLWDEDGYHFWGIWYNTKCQRLYYMSSKDAVHWSDLQLCTIPCESSDMWHGSISRNAAGYHFVWVGRTGKQRNRIYYAKSKDGLTFSDSKLIIQNDAGWEFLYRPSMLIVGDQYYCYYGVIRCDGKWMIAMSYGDSIQSMVGITEQDIPYDEGRVATTRKLRCKHYINKLKSLIVPRLFALAPILFVLLFVLKSTWIVWGIGVLLCACAYYYKFDRKRFVSGGLLMGTACSCIASYAYILLLELSELLLCLST